MLQHLWRAVPRRKAALRQGRVLFAQILAGTILASSVAIPTYGTPPPPVPQHINLPEAATTVSMQGSVRVAGGGTISRGVKVRVEDLRGDMLAEQYVSTAGQFGFSNLPKIAARVVVTGEGYEPYSESVDLGRIANIYFINVSLTPIAKVKEKAPPLSSRTDLAAPKDARKEFEAGSRALADKKIRQAQSHLEKAVSIYPCYARAQAGLGLVSIAEHKSAPAEAALRKAIECDPDFIDSYMELGQLLNGDQRYAESRPVLEEGIRRSPGAWQFFYQLGVCYFGMGKIEDAEQAYLKAQSFSTDLPAEIHIKLADIYVKEKAFDKAYAQMQAYLKAEPNGRFAARTKNVMTQMAAAGVVSAAAVKTSPPNSAPQQYR